LVCDFDLGTFLVSCEWRGEEEKHMIRQEASLLMSRYIVPEVNNMSVLYMQPVSHAGYK
jgi:hypothetical protein